MKPPIATLRINGCIVAIYTHDLINVGATFQEIADNVMASVELLDSRSSRPEVFCKKGALKNFTTFTGKYLCQSLFFNKVAGLRLWHRCFPVNFVKFLRTSFFIKHLWWLLLQIYRREVISDCFYPFKHFSILNFAITEWFCQSSNSNRTRSRKLKSYTSNY